MGTFLRQVLDQLRIAFDPTLLGDAMAAIVAKTFVACAVFAGFYAAWWIVSRMLRLVLGRANVDPTTRSFVQMVVKILILFFGAVNALRVIGIDTAALVTSLGIAGLTIGFAAKDALSNIISGLFIYWDRPFVLNDLIEVGGHYGRVDRITLRSTRVITTDGRMLAIPNAEMVNTTVASYTNFPHLRLDIPVTIGVAERIGPVRKLLLDLVRSDPDYMADPPASVSVTELGDYNITLVLCVWIENERNHSSQRAVLREQVFETLTEAGVDMPFETFRLEPVEIAGRLPG